MENTCIKSKLEATLINIDRSLRKSEHLFDNSSYETGILGLSLYYRFFHLYSGNSDDLGNFERTLLKGIYDFDIGKFSKVYKSDSLDNHLSNIGRYLMFLKRKGLINADVNAYLTNLDETMFKLLESKISVGDFDYNSGAFASGYYFLARANESPYFENALRALITGLESSAQQDEEGALFWNSPSLWNNTYFGLSHGSAMVVSFVSTVRSLGIESERCELILRKAANFLLKHAHSTPYGRFPTNFLNKHVVGEKPFCICYGDLGVAYALFKANKFINNPDIQHHIDTIFEESLTRGRTTPYPPDAGITYGAAGLAAFFFKLYELTNDDRFLEASGYWCEQILTYAIDDERCGGFRSLGNQDYDFWNVSFGWGVIGIGLALMKHLKPEIPEYSELLMVV